MNELINILLATRPRPYCNILTTRQNISGPTYYYKSWESCAISAFPNLFIRYWMQSSD